MDVTPDRIVLAGGMNEFNAPFPPLTLATNPGFSTTYDKCRVAMWVVNLPNQAVPHKIKTDLPEAAAWYW